MSQQLATERATSTVFTTADLSDVVKRWPDEAARIWTHEAVEGAADNEAIEVIVATGSSVRDVEHSDDLDLVLVYGECRPILPRQPISIDLRLYEQDDVLQKLAACHDYLSWTVRYGRVLFERCGW